MARRRQQEAKEEFTHLSLRVESYEASISAGVNHNAYSPEYAWDLDESDPVYKFTNQLQISAITTWPSSRASDRFELTLLGDDASSIRLDATLKDIRARDSDGSSRYRTYRGKEVPILAPPSGLGTLQKVRGERTWTAWLFVTVGFVDQWRTMLMSVPSLYIGLHECKIDRTRWVRSVSLQTVDPSEE